MNDKELDTSTESQSQSILTIAVEEYNALRQEIITRIGLVNSQSHTAILTILTIWGSGFALLANLPKIIETHNFFSPIPLMLLSCFVFLVPIFYFLPLSIKSGENLKQITSLTVYIKAFHEQYSIQKGEKLFYWCTISENFENSSEHSKELVSYFTFLYNIEYTVLACSSLAIYSTIATSLLCGYIAHNIYEDILMYVVLFVVMFIIGFVCCIFIFIFSNAQKTVNKEKNILFKHYLENAGELGCFPKEKIGDIYIKN